MSLVLLLKLWSGRADLNCRPSEPHVAFEKGGGRLPPFLGLLYSYFILASIATMVRSI